MNYKDNTLLIWKYLLPRLTSNENLTRYISENKMFPLVAKSDTTYPFLIYKRDGISPRYSKSPNGGWTNNITITVTIYSDNYPNSVYIANEVRDSLEFYSYEDDDIRIYPIELISAFESFGDDMFMQQLSFNVSAV